MRNRNYPDRLQRDQKKYLVTCLTGFTRKRETGNSTLKIIRNPRKWRRKLHQVCALRDKAIKNHKKRLDLEHEAIMIMTSILAYEIRHEQR